jgi:hypothetical protein
MPPSDPAEQADHQEGEQSGTTKRPLRDRHGRRDTASGTLPTGPRYTVGPPKTVPMTEDEYARAVQAWAILIAAWRTDNSADDEDPPQAHHDM